MTRKKQTSIITLSFLSIVITVFCFLQTLTLLQTKPTIEAITKTIDTYKTMLLILIVNQILHYIVFFFTFEEVIPYDDD